MHIATLMLLGSGELGREFAIAAKRLGCRVIACDRYANAPAMQIADAFEVFPMLDGKALRAAVEKHQAGRDHPGDRGDRHRYACRARERGMAGRALGQGRAADHEPRRHSRVRGARTGLTTSRYNFAEIRDEAIAAAAEVGLPCVVKPVMSSSGKGQTTAKPADEVGAAWDYAVANMRGDRPRVIVEEFIEFDSEITLLTVATEAGVLFCPPIGHRQEAGDYRESWQPAGFPTRRLLSARARRAKSSRRSAATASSGSSSSSTATRRSFRSCRRARTTPAW